MTIPTGLELVWADAGGTTDPGNAKYQLGWVAEIPTFQNFNHVLQALDKTKLSFAESDIYPWQDKIAYAVGARVLSNTIRYTCITAHNDNAGTDPQDPTLDTTNSYWVTGTLLSAESDAVLNQTEGLKLDRINKRTSKTVWQGNDATLNNESAVLALNTPTAADDNFLFANVQGKIVVVNVGTKTIPDGTTSLLPSVNNNAHHVFHEGNEPNITQVVNGLEKNPEDGVLYGRRDGNWVKVTATTISIAPPPPVAGDGAMWYNLDDGTTYVDIDDGDSSQWVPVSPPTVPENYRREFVHNFATLAAAIASSKIEEGDSCELIERLSGNGGGGKWKVVLANTVTPNGTYIVACTGIPTLALLLVVESLADIKQFGAVGDGVADDQPAIQAAIDYIASIGGGSVYIPVGVFNVNSTIILPDFDTPTSSFGDVGMRIYGASRNGSNIVTSLDIDVFTLNDFYNFSHFSIQQRGTIGTGKAMYASNQVRFITMYDMNVISFKYGCLMRYTLWMAWRDIYFVGCTCGVRLSRNILQEDQTNPPSGHFWNLTNKDVSYTKTFVANTFQDNTENWVVDVLKGARMRNVTQNIYGTILDNTSTTVTVVWDSGNPQPWNVGDQANISGIGFFNNQLTFDNILCNGGEIGIWASCMGATFNNVTCQNQETEGLSNSVLPAGQAGTGMWLDGGGEGASNSFNNTILSYYTEDTHISLKIENTRIVTVHGWFAQGKGAPIAGDALLWIKNSKINMTAQTGSASWTNAIVAVDSFICNAGPIQASGGNYDLTNSKVILDGIFDEDGNIGTAAFPHNNCYLEGALFVGGTDNANRIRHVDKGTFTATLTPENSGSTPLDPTADLMLFTKIDRLVTINGRIDVGVVVTPTGTWLDIGTLPYLVNSSSERGGNAGGGQCVMFQGATQTLLPVIFLEGSSTARIYMDASTLLGGEQFFFTLNYVTTT